MQPRPPLSRIPIAHLAALGLVLPFVLKPPHIDEESYLFIAQAIQDHPLRPYDWWRAWQPWIEPGTPFYVYAHPPLFLWYLCGIGHLIGFGHPWHLRVAMFPFIVLLVSALSSLTRSLTHAPRRAALALLSAPGLLLVLHQSLMIDLPFVALSLKALSHLLRREKTEPARAAWVGGLWLGAAALTKYPALVLLPLGFVSLRDHRKPIDVGSGGRFLVGAMLLFIPWQFWTWLQYGEAHLLFVLSHAEEIAHSPFSARAVGLLSQLGASVLGVPILLWAILSSKHERHRLLLALLGTIGLALFLHAVPRPSAPLPPGRLGRLMDSFVGIVPTAPLNQAFLVATLFLGLRLILLPRARHVSDRFLLAWSALTLGSVLLGHNFVGARYLVPAAIPLGLLTWRRLERAHSSTIPKHFPFALIANAAITLWVARADYRLAEAYPNLALMLDDSGLLAGHEPASIFFIGEWGFRREMASRHYRFARPDIPLHPGDLLILPHIAGPPAPPDEISARELGRLSIGTPGLRVLAPGEGIGFYSEAIGLLPYGWGKGPLEAISVWEIESDARENDASTGKGSERQSRPRGEKSIRSP